MLKFVPLPIVTVLLDFLLRYEIYEHFKEEFDNSYPKIWAQVSKITWPIYLLESHLTTSSPVHSLFPIFRKYTILWKYSNSASILDHSVKVFLLVSTLLRIWIECTRFEIKVIYWKYIKTVLSVNCDCEAI